MKSRAGYVAPALALVMMTLLVSPGRAAAAETGAGSQVSVFTGSGWTLRLHSVKSRYRSIQGTLRHGTHQYHVEGDWIPAADAGGDLLRFYGHALPRTSYYGLVGVATLYNTCNPNCAAGRHYALKALSQWSLPGTARRNVILVVQ